MKSFRILIVEDEILIADLIKRYLVQGGHEVVGIAISFEEAQAIYETQKPDIALLDIRLNGTKTGVDFGYYLNSQQDKIPFIYLTSQLDSQNINLAKKTLPAGYLSKPIAKKSLYANIEVAMHKHHFKNETEPKITLINGNMKFLIPVKDILYIQAKHIYFRVFITQGQEVLQRSTLKGILRKLPRTDFLHIHRSYVINAKHVVKWDNQRIFIGDTIIPLSRTGKKIFETYIGQILPEEN